MDNFPEKQFILYWKVKFKVLSFYSKFVLKISTMKLQVTAKLSWKTAFKNYGLQITFLKNQ